MSARRLFQEDDADWFAAHPRRRFRFRPVFPDEAGGLRGWRPPSGDHVLFTLVKQITPNCRERRYLAYPRGAVIITNLIAGRERQLRELFESFERDGGAFSLSDAYAQLARDELQTRARQ